MFSFLNGRCVLSLLVESLEFFRIIVCDRLIRAVLRLSLRIQKTRRDVRRLVAPFSDVVGITEVITVYGVVIEFFLILMCKK